MTTVVFYEKPGCAGNARQKRWLAAAGVRLDVRSLAEESWSAERLRSFFGARPVVDWFNRSAPRVKSGEIDIDRITPAQALALMLADPLLVRRPLIEVGGARTAGFDPAWLQARLGLPADAPSGRDLDRCPRDAGREMRR